MPIRMWLRAGAIAVLAAGSGVVPAVAQPSPPLPPYVPPPTTAPLAPLPGTPDAPEGPLGAVRTRSDSASNNGAADTRSTLAPALPTPQEAGDDARSLLLAARAALQAGRTGEAQEALERAESRLLSRDVAPSDAGTAIAGPAVERIGAARQALSVGNSAAALREIDAAVAGER